MCQKVVVTGADGFVGKVLCRRLIDAGHSTRAGLLNGERWPTLRAAVPGLSEYAVIGDLAGEPQNFEAAFEKVTTVIHLAARVHVMQDSALDPLTEYRRVNVHGTMLLARAAARKGVRRMVFVSSAKVNGESTTGESFTELDPPNPQDPYAISKSEAEEELRSMAMQTGLEVTIVRPPLVYGPGVRANFLRLMKWVQWGVPLPLPDSHNRRSLIGVENLADFLLMCTAHPKAANETFMVSDGEDVSTRELIRRLAQALGCPARFVPVPELPIRLAARLVGREAALSRLLGSLVINGGFGRQQLGWTPPVSLDVGLKAAAHWYISTLGQVS